MKSVLLAVSVGLVALLGVTRAAHVDDIEAKQFLENLSKELFDFYDLPYRSRSDIYTTIRTQNQLLNKVMETIQSDYSKLQDPELREIFRSIGKTSGLIFSHDKVREKQSDVDGELSQLSDEEIAAYRKGEEDLTYVPDIQSLIAKSNDPAELLHYWEEWRKTISESSEEVFSATMEWVREAANLSGVPVTELWEEFYDIDEMEAVVKQLRPLYTQLHSFIRNNLFQKYGELVINPNGPIPDHLFQQILTQTWTNDSVIEKMYPFKNLPPYDAFLKEKGYTAGKIYRTANEFYTSLGFPSLPKYYWGRRIQMFPMKDSDECRLHINERSLKVRLYYCPKMDFRTFLEAHDHMGRVYYVLEKKNLPFYYFYSYALEHPVGKAVMLSAATSKHLKAIGLAENFLFTTDPFMNRHLRMGMEALLKITTSFVNNKVTYDFITNKVDMKGLNKHYWKLMEEFLGVEPPTDRTDHSLDFPYEFLERMIKDSPKKTFMTQILGYQFYRKFCQISGQYPSSPLYDCDFYGSKPVGDAMKQMMQMGSTKPWRTVLGTLLPGDNKFNGDAFLEYYQPMENWLQAQNYAAGVKIGWDPSTKTVV